MKAVISVDYLSTLRVGNGWRLQRVYINGWVYIDMNNRKSMFNVGRAKGAASSGAAGRPASQPASQAGSQSVSHPASMALLGLKPIKSLYNLNRKISLIIPFLLSLVGRTLVVRKELSSGEQEELPSEKEHSHTSQPFE